MARQPISVLIVDDHPVVRQGLRVLLEVQDGIAVAAEAGDGPAALALAAEHVPDVILLDLKLPGMDGIAVLGELAAQDSPSRVLVLTSMTEPAAAAAALRAGAAGVLYKDVDPDALVRAIRAVHDGHFLLAPEAAGSLLRSGRSGGRPGRPDQQGTRGPGRAGPRPVQPGNRPGSARLGENRQDPRKLGTNQTRRGGPYPGCAGRGPPRAARLINRVAVGWPGAVT